MGRPARKANEYSRQAPPAAPSPRTMAALFDHARRAETLEELTGLFAGMIAERGFSEHLCIAITGDGTLAPLFGDTGAISPRAVTEGLAADDPRRPFVAHGVKPGQLVLPVQCWHGGDLFLCLGGQSGTPDPALRASLQGWAEVYATFGVALLERSRDQIGRAHV